MRVRDFLRRDLTSLDRDTPLGQAIRLLERSGHAALPVVDEEGRVIGVLSERDIIRALLPGYLDLLRSASFLPSLNQMAKKLREIERLPVERFMTREVVTCRPEDTDLHVADLMLRKGLKQIPVVDAQGRLIGQVRRIDLLSHL
ncbi:MAG: CBS domain-containing protein [Candidatus Bipolaricaulota bacterium]|nr:CBS domain-containing protein [Candidatus Bipolaricaulota bacterium]